MSVKEYYYEKMAISVLSQIHLLFLFTNLVDVYLQEGHFQLKDAFQSGFSVCILFGFLQTCYEPTITSQPVFFCHLVFMTKNTG